MNDKHQSDTPLTDAQSFRAETMELPCGDGPTKILECVSADFARQLERERAELREALSRIAVVTDGKHVFAYHTAKQALAATARPEDKV